MEIRITGFPKFDSRLYVTEQISVQTIRENNCRLNYENSGILKGENCLAQTIVIPSESDLDSFLIETREDDGAVLAVCLAR